MLVFKLFQFLSWQLLKRPNFNLFGYEKSFILVRGENEFNSFRRLKNLNLDYSPHSRRPERKHETADSAPRDLRSSRRSLYPHM